MISVMLQSGLVSVTFRKLAPARIIELVAKAGLTGIEWGGDIHVPHGEIATAEIVRRQTEEAGLQVCAYGSYYRSAESEEEGQSFEPVLETAHVLGAPLIRVWPGRRGSEEAGSAYRRSVADNLQEIGETASEVGIGIALEFHGNTLTDTVDSAMALMREVNHPNVKLYWQQPHGETTEARLEGLKAVLPHLSHIHAFHWEFRDGQHQRRPLSEGTSTWRSYIEVIRGSAANRFVLLEFVRNDDPEQFLRDAEILKDLLEYCPSEKPGGIGA